VDIDTGDGLLTLYVNHFKSMLDTSGGAESGREKTRANRERQVQAVKQIITERHQGAFDQGAFDQITFVVLGDFNDYLEDDPQGRSAIREIVAWDQVENAVTRRSADVRWTHFYDGADEYRQLDYMLLSESGVPQLVGISGGSDARSPCKSAGCWCRRGENL